MNWFDIVLILILVASVLTSFRKGLSREIIGLISVVAGLILGVWFYGSAAEYLAPHMSSPLAAKLGGFFLVFFAVVLTGSLVRFVVGKFLRVTGLSIFDHALGAVFGLLRGGLIAVALITGMMAFAKDGRPPQAIVNSRVAPYIANGSKVAVAIAPHELKEGFNKAYGEAKVAWNAALEETTKQARDGKGK